MSRTRWTSSDRPAMSASSGSVQSISTTWTATSSALAWRACSATRRTIRASLGPPLSATTARRKAGAWASDMASHDTTGDVRAVARQRRPDAASPGGLDGRRSGARRCSPPSAASNMRRVLASVGDGDDDRVRPAEQDRPEPLGRLVVEDPLPPAAGDVLGDDHEGDRRRACPAARPRRGRRGRRAAARRAPDTATRRRPAGRPGSGARSRPAAWRPPRGRR